MIKRSCIKFATVFGIVLLARLLNVNAQGDFSESENYPIWENTTKYSKIYVVNQNHKNANDTNSGTEAAPLRTIHAAVTRVRAGEKILIHKGIYREMIEPVRGGEGSNKMISLESVEGDKVFIRGSKILENKWTREVTPDKKSMPPSVTQSSSKKLWMTTIDDAFFETGYYPFKLMNLEEQDYEKIPEAERIRNKSPFSLTRALIFQNGERMIQLNHYGDLVHVQGSFWVDTDKRTIHIHPFANKNPNEEEFEITIKAHLLKPIQAGLNYIQVKGLVFEHCSNGFVSGNGAIMTLDGNHWIFENNLIREINGSGLEIGSDSQETGFINVRNNIIYFCGTSGIHSNRVRHAIIKNNEVGNCGWQDAEDLNGCAGIKFIKADNCLISNNLVHHINCGAGIWIQTDSKNSRISRNIIHDISTIRGALVLESSTTPNLVDNNFI
jgi:alpha-L-arabinofuranosidase